MGLTLRLAGATTALLMLFTIPLAWWLARRKGSLPAAVQAVISLPLVLPPTVLGFYLLVTMGPTTSAGRLLIRILGHPLAFSFAGLLVGSMLYSLPFAVQPMVTGFQALDEELIEAAGLLGAGPFSRFLEVALPLTRGSLVTGAVLTFTHTVGEFGVVLMLGGNIPGSTRTLSISLYDMVEEGRYAEANRTALWLVGVALVALLALHSRVAGRRRLV